MKVYKGYSKPACILNKSLMAAITSKSPFSIYFYEMIHAARYMQGFLYFCNGVLPGRQPEPLIHRCLACESSTESSQHRGKLRAIAQCERCKVTHQQNSSLHPRTAAWCAQVKKITMQECAICEESVEHNSVHQLEHPREQTGSALGRA